MVEVLLERPSELQRVERVAARDLVDAEQRRPGERPFEALVHEPLERADTNRPHGQHLHRVLGQCQLELGAVDPLADASREHQDDRLLEPPKGERDRVHRRAIEPLDIVDRDDERAGRSEDLEAVPYSYSERTRICRVGRVAEKESCLERLASGRRERGDDLTERALEEVAEPGEGEVTLRLRRSRREHPKTELAGGLDSRHP